MSCLSTNSPRSAARFLFWLWDLDWMRTNLTSFLAAVAAIFLMVAVALSAKWMWLSRPLLYLATGFGAAALIRFCWLEFLVKKRSLR
jgi:hypothetical protein